MGANRGAEGGASPAVPGLICGALKAGVHHGDTEGTENGIGNTAHASLSCVLTQSRKGAKTAMVAPESKAVSPGREVALQPLGDVVT